MARGGPFGLLGQILDVLDRFSVPYAIGGSVAGSFAGEPRSTVDVDLAVQIGPADLERVLAALPRNLYVPIGAARSAVQDHTSFNVVDPVRGLKVDVFVVGSGLLDRRQIERAVRHLLPGSEREVRVTAAEDLVLRKLEWYRATGSTSERQWRDVIGILEVQEGRLDLDDLRETADQVGLGEDLRRALVEAATPPT